MVVFDFHGLHGLDPGRNDDALAGFSPGHDRFDGWEVGRSGHIWLTRYYKRW